MNVAYPIISDVHKTTYLTEKLLNIHVASITQPHLASVSSKELPLATLVSKNPLFLLVDYGFLEFYQWILFHCKLEIQRNCYRIWRHPSSCEQALLRATRICVVPCITEHSFSF